MEVRPSELPRSMRTGRAWLAVILVLSAATSLPVSVQAAPQQRPTKAAGAPGPADAVSIPEIGIKLAPITSELRTRYAIAHAYAGPVVTEVEANGPAAGKLNVGDEIVQIGSDVVSAPESVARSLEALRQPGRTSAILDVVSPEGYLRFVNVPLRSPERAPSKS